MMPADCALDLGLSMVDAPGRSHFIRLVMAVPSRACR
jgi:hypothetical protein